MGDNDETQASLSKLENIKATITSERASIVSEVCDTLSVKLSESLASTLSIDLTKSLSATITKSLASDIENAVTKAFHGITAKVDDLEKAVDANSRDLMLIKNEFDQLKRTIVNQQSEIDSLKYENNNLKSQISECASKAFLRRLSDVEELIEERTNRQLRQTLVFRGIEEKGKESWNDTKHRLAESIAETCDITYDEAASSINRCHRSAPRLDKNGRSVRNRPIYANFFSWDKTENIVQCYRDSNIEFPNFNIKADYKYGPLTSKRRSEALKTRKELKDRKIISKGYIQYPAKLRVMYTGENQCRVHQDFSKMVFANNEEEVQT